jgi:hypothetical protein
MNFVILIVISIIIVVGLIVWYSFRDTFGNVNKNRKHSKNVYISMTTIPEHLKSDWWYNNLKRNMSFLDSNHSIIVNIPNVSLKGEKYIIPDKVINLQKENSEQLILNRVDKDEGPITKLLPTLRNNIIKDSDIIIICDDDLYYKPNVFKLLEQGVNSNPNEVSSMCNGEKYQGFIGTGFKKRLMKNILNFNYPKSCIKVDDEIIDFYIKINNINYNTILKNGNEWYCSILPNETDKERPKWYELNKDNRLGHTLNCKTDLKKILKIVS